MSRKAMSPEDYLRCEVYNAIKARIDKYGVDEICERCHERCKMPRIPHNGTLVECFLHPGPLVADYWTRRHRESRRAANNRQKRGALGALEARAPRQAPSSSTSNGKEVTNNDHRRIR